MRPRSRARWKAVLLYSIGQIETLLSKTGTPDSRIFQSPRPLGGVSPSNSRSVLMSGYALIVLVLTLVTGCDIFQTRDPEPPNQGTSSYIPPDQPATVLQNIQSAVTEANADNYARSLSDSDFTFVPSAEVAARYATTFRAWNAASERTWFRNLGTPLNGTPQLTLTNIVQSRVGSDSVLYTMDYSFYYPHRRAGIPKLVTGKMELDMRPNAARLWYIATWHDFRTSSDSTWSYLKAVFSEN